MGYVPAIIDGDVVLADSMAILLVCNFYQSIIAQFFKLNRFSFIIGRENLQIFFVTYESNIYIVACMFCSFLILFMKRKYLFIFRVSSFYDTVP
jgi:hypothetical protein